MCFQSVRDQRLVHECRADGARGEHARDDRFYRNKKQTGRDCPSLVRVRPSPSSGKVKAAVAGAGERETRQSWSSDAPATEQFSFYTNIKADDVPNNSHSVLVDCRWSLRKCPFLPLVVFHRRVHFNIMFYSGWKTVCGEKCFVIPFKIIYAPAIPYIVVFV